MNHGGAFDCNGCGGQGCLVGDTVDSYGRRDDYVEECAACDGKGAQICSSCDEGVAVVQAGPELWFCTGCAASAKEAA